MFELIISVCMLTSPQSCKEVHLTYLGNITPFQCWHRGMPEIAKWSLSHQEWDVKKFRCGKVDVSRKQT